MPIKTVSLRGREYGSVPAILWVPLTVHLTVNETGVRTRLNDKCARKPAGRKASSGEYGSYSPHAMRRIGLCLRRIAAIISA